MKAYKDDYELKEDEYLLKIRPGRPKTGFLSKFNKNGTFPIAFAKWGTPTKYVAGVGHVKEEPLPIHVIKEEFRSGWKLDGWRYGMSQNWASVVHPKGFTVEIYLGDFLGIIKRNTIVKGKIKGEFKWEKNKLIKKK